MADYSAVGMGRYAKPGLIMTTLGAAAAVGTHFGPLIELPPGLKGISLELITSGGGAGASTGQMKLQRPFPAHDTPADAFTDLITQASTAAKTGSISWNIFNVPTGTTYTAGDATLTGDNVKGVHVPMIFRPAVIVAVDTLIFRVVLNYWI